MQFCSKYNRMFLLAMSNKKTRSIRSANLPPAVSFLLILELIIGVVSSLILALIFYKIFNEVLQQDTLNLDILISKFIYLWRTPFLTKIMLIITNFGAGYMIAISLIATLFLIWRKHQREVVTFLIIFIIGVFLNIALKSLIQRPRPDISPITANKQVISLSSYSFPSGHAMNSTVFYLALAFYFYHLTHNKKLSLLVTFSLLILLFLIGFSRVYLGVHYPSDVLAGNIVGLWWLVTALSINKSLVLVRAYQDEKGNGAFYKLFIPENILRRRRMN